LVHRSLRTHLELFVRVLNLSLVVKAVMVRLPDIVCVSVSTLV
jgi:hypothetical protein